MNEDLNKVILLPPHSRPWHTATWAMRISTAETSVYASISLDRRLLIQKPFIPHGDMQARIDKRLNLSEVA